MGKVLKGVALAAVFVGLAFATGGASVLAAGATAAAGSTVVAGVAFTGLGTTLFGMAVASVLSGITGQFFGPKMPKTQLSRLNASLDPSTPRKVVFGTTAMPIDIRYHEASGTDQEYVDYVIAVAAHEVASIDEIWFEDNKAWDSTSGVTAKYSGYLTNVTIVEAGTSSNYVTISAKWNAGINKNRLLTGCAYLRFKIKRTGNSKKAESPLVQGLPSRITIIGEGALLYDPRLDSTVTGGSGAHRADDQATWGAYSGSDDYDNPALQLLWWLLGWNINGKLSVGCGIPPERIDLESFITAANICDEAITLDAGGTQPRYRSSGTASDADGRIDIINNLLVCMNGTLRDSGGKLALTIMKNDLADPVLDFTDDDILDSFDWQQTRGLDQNYNIVRGRYVDPSQNSLYNLVEYPSVSITSPDGIERSMTLDLPYVEDGNRAQRIAKQMLQRNQYRGMFSANFSLKALGCSVGDVVSITFTPLGWSSKLFRIVSQEISLTGVVPMSMIEENAAIYAWDAEESAVVTATAPTIYDPLNHPFILGIGDAEAIADGKITTFFQTTAPTADALGDLWFDTDDNNKVYRWNGSSWVEARDSEIAVAISDAATAQATADGKVTSFYQATAPTPEADGDLWFETDANNQLWRWDASSSLWVLAADTRVTAAINTDGTIANSKVVTASIVSNAVSKITAANSTTSLTIGSGFTVIQQVSFTTDGGPILVTGSFLNYAQPVAAGSHGIVYYLSIPSAGGTQFYYSTQYAPGGGATYQFRQQCTLTTHITGMSAGTYTGYLYARLYNTNSQAGTLTADRNLTITELKK